MMSFRKLFKNCLVIIIILIVFDYLGEERTKRKKKKKKQEKKEKKKKENKPLGPHSTLRMVLLCPSSKTPTHR